MYKRQTSTKVAISIADVKGNDEANGKDIADLKQVVTQAEPCLLYTSRCVEETATHVLQWGVQKAATW